MNNSITMNLTGKKYPRIYSISTVGIRNHNNTDLLVHPLRTDFTGQSGTGKSLIAADIPQLILTGGKYYKSATPSNDPREYNELPLKKCAFAYAFMNIEIEKGKFIVIGVMIKRAPKQLTPFIIQGLMGLDAENNPKFKPLEKIIRFKDFIENEEMLKLENFQTKFDKQQIYLTSFYHKTSAYHKLLNENNILHLDLSDDDNLQKQYAHSLQTLSRGKEIATEGNLFKKFLFHYDDEIEKKFKEQSKSIEDDHRKYEADYKTQSALSKKRTAMARLLILKKAKVAAFEQRQINETVFYFQQVQLKEAELKIATQQYYQTELEIITIKERTIQIEIDLLTKDKGEKSLELKKQQDIFDKAKERLDLLEIDLKNLKDVLPIIEKERDELKAKYDKYTQAENWLKVYNSIDATKNKFTLQKDITEQKNKLKELNSFLKNNNLHTLFEESKYSKTIKSAIIFYKDKKEQLEQQIESTKKLKEIIQNQNSESFAGWAVSEGIKLNELQESILFHFATLPTHYNGSEHYIPEPDKFIKALQKEVRKTDTGFIINLSGLYYHIKSRESYIFGNPQKIKAELEKIGKDFQTTLNNHQIEINKINNLEKLFSEFNYSQEHLTAYLNKDNIQDFVIDPTLNLLEHQFNEIIAAYSDNILLEEQQRINFLYSEKQKLYENKLGLRSTNEQNKTNQSEIQTQAKTLIDTLTSDIEKKGNKIINLQNVELSEITNKFTNWKSNPANPIQNNQDELFHQYRLKYKSQIEEAELTTPLVDLSRKSGTLEGDIKTINSILPTLTENYLNKRKEFKSYFQKEFIPDSILEPVTEDMLNGEKGIKAKESSTKLSYETEYESVINSFDEELKDNPTIKKHNYDLNALILELIPHEIISNKENPEDSLETDIESKLAKLNQQIKELNKEEATKIYNTVKDLKRIVLQQTTFLDTVKALLKDFKLANYNKVLLEWKYSSDYNLKWIESLSRDIEDSNFTANLFGEESKISAQDLLVSNFKKYCPSKIEPKANEILNPFNYYDASAKIVDPNDEKNPGSSGQNYGMLALLCIAKLSIVEGKTKDGIEKIEKGIRILPIDEVAGLGENFDMLYDIAQRLDYQIFTMTITANDLTFENGKQIYYEFVKNSNEKLFEYNEGIQACFSKDDLIGDIETHFADSIFSLESIVE